MRFVDLFCGIGGFRLGLEAAGFEHSSSAEWADAPRAIYAARFGAAPTWRDVSAIQADEIEGGPGVVWAGGFPCQDASSAGKGLGLLGGKRSSLVFRVLGLSAVARPEWLFLENVPGLLVRGRGFGNLLGVMARIGYGVAWRRVDSQFHGLAQRRKRVLLVACLGARAGMRRAAQVLLEPPGLLGDPPAREAAGARVARCLAASAAGGGAEGSRDELVHSWAPSVSPTLTRSEGHHGRSSPRGDGSTPLVAGFNAYAAGGSETGWTPEGSPPLRGGNPPAAVIAFDWKKAGEHSEGVSPTLRSGGHDKSHPNGGVCPAVVIPGAFVRRLTVRECERLQGFPDDWTQVDGLSDSARYKALGNAVSVPVIEWVARRLAREVRA